MAYTVAKKNPGYQVRAGMYTDFGIWWEPSPNTWNTSNKFCKLIGTWQYLIGSQLMEPCSQVLGVTVRYSEDPFKCMVHA